MVSEPRDRRLRLKAQPIEPLEYMHKFSLKLPVIHYLPLFIEFLFLDTKLSLSFIATLVVHYNALYIQCIL
jgi:hypothetical protein